MPIRVLVVDDSAFVRRALTEILQPHTDIEVAGTASNPYVARDKILQLQPDVITLDLEMPRMDGLTFLRLLMKHRPTPVVIMSSLTAENSSLAFETLQAGAVEVLQKPAGAHSTIEDGCRLAEVIRVAARARLPRSDAGAGLTAPTHARRPSSTRRYNPHEIILMGASTGGTEALKTVLTGLSADLPGICIVQHIPAHFSLAFANRLNSLCAMEVRQARHGDLITRGTALVAPGGRHMVLRRLPGGYQVVLSDGPLVHYQRPAVDVLFGSALRAGAGPRTLAVLLTGMGADGASSMLELKNAGADTIAQDEQSCVVFGMPREAIRLGAAQSVLPLNRISQRIEAYAESAALGIGPPA
jgi:two-component system chemotaxis response regulator CheB